MVRSTCLTPVSSSQTHSLLMFTWPDMRSTRAWSWLWSSILLNQTFWLQVRNQRLQAGSGVVANVLSGGSDSELYIWDIKNPKTMKFSKPHSGEGKLNAGQTCVAWNRKVAQIIASSSEIGETNIFDLRQKKAIITFREEGHQLVRATAIAWHPSLVSFEATC